MRRNIHWPYGSAAYCGLLALTCCASLGCRPREPQPPPTAASQPEIEPTQAPQTLPNVDAPLDAPLDADANPKELSVSPVVASVASAGEVAPTSPPPSDRFEPTGNWSTRRIVMLAPHGPQRIDIAISIGGMSLEQTADATALQMAEELLVGLETSTWEELLAVPLVQSGWLGNLVADTDEQRADLIARYDTNSDRLADLAELPPFLTRGLSRNSPLQLVEGSETTATSDSPWGVADLDRDNALDLTSELDMLTDSLSRLDSNGDGIVTRQEVSENNAMQAMSDSRRSLLDANRLLKFEPPAAGEDEQQANQRLRKGAVELMRFYTFLDTIPRDQFIAWPDSWWQRFDSNADQALDRAEVIQWLNAPASISLFVQLPTGLRNATETPAPMATMVRRTTDPTVQSLIDDAVGASWQARPAGGGRLVMTSCSLRVEAVDDFNAVNWERLRSLFQQALANPQLESSLRTQLQLSQGAFSLLDANRDGSLDDAEFAASLRWLGVRQAARLILAYRPASPAWFELGDLDGDGRLTALEIQSMREPLRRLDLDGDGQITPYELPLLASLEIRRSDQRLANLIPATQEGDAPPIVNDWFAAMDTNGDGTLSRAEFLGNSENFSDLD